MGINAMKKDYRKVGDSIMDRPEPDPRVNRKQVTKCPNCGTCTFKGTIGPGTLIEIRCRRCKLDIVVEGI